MLASLLRPRKRRPDARESSPLLRRQMHAPDTEDETNDDDGSGYDPPDDEDGPEGSTPLLPIFSAPHLDALPVFNITHALRLLVAARCETTLSWDQLRSPQVSQFLLKPIQQEIRAAHFSRATLFALMANCLQFNKEVHLNPGNSGTSRTRAMVCELLAIKLLKEFTTRELIDALSYDFDPLQGQSPPTTGSTVRGPAWGSGQRNGQLVGAARISCLEIAIRAQAKRFLAHPLVVQQLEAIWAGTIVFHSAADSLHRAPPRASPEPGYGSCNGHGPSANGKPDPDVQPRRSVTLYDPRDASLFKLSRLRVPRYRQFLSTCSFAVLLALFLAVIVQRPLEITTLEIVFWFWSAGFMLDEIVGFNEQGFSLYLMSFWNTFDLGILLLLFCYYCMRLYGVVMPSTRKHAVADQAYDILAANAVLLFPRLFSVLDHHRYFSQLLVAFRMMAADLVAVFVLIIIACSGFFVAFTCSFGDGGNNSPGSVAYALFQMLMGFTPAAWNLWDRYNTLGRIILTLFLFVCHFVVVTILITVLTNSFMAIVQNANEEHQFVFAVNTISMVKSDALFSYVAPTNIIAWLITPLRYVMPFRQFVRLNRTVIKITHFPILFTICLYERTILSSTIVEPTDLVEARGRSAAVARARRPRNSRLDAFSPHARLVREPSIATYRKDRALEEVFRRPFADDTFQKNSQRTLLRRRQNSNIVQDWMRGIGPEPAHPPDEQDRAEVERLEAAPPRLPRRFARRRTLTGTVRDFTETTYSFTTDRDQFSSFNFPRPAAPRRRSRDSLSLSPTQTRELSQHTDIEGDDELTSGDNADDDSTEGRRSLTSHPVSRPADGNTPTLASSRPSTARLTSGRNSPSRRPRTPGHAHARKASSATILYRPVGMETDDEPSRAPASLAQSTKSSKSSQVDSGAATPAGWRTPRPDPDGRPILSPQSEFQSVPDLAGFAMSDARARRNSRPSSVIFGLGSDLGDNQAVGGGFVGTAPSSFTSQMAYATGGLRRESSQNDSQDVLSRLVLARMNNLEEGFREVIREVKDLRQGRSSRSQSRGADRRWARERKRRAKKGAQGSGRSKASSESWVDSRSGYES
ncbi:putative cation channel family transporter [Thermoascus aurantiacus ATCC 26904]